MLGSVTGVGLRGSPPSATTYPAGMGEGCLFDTGLSYGRVQWQTEHCASVPDNAQGIGLVIVRDFGRYLADDFDVRVIGGASQSAWFVNTLIAEGFNVDPVDGTGVYTGALSYLSAGNWLALNRLADDGAPQYPYVRPARAPLTAAEMLSRPESDPFFVDITSYTEYYRLRGSVFASAPLPARARHYDFPAPHGPGSPEFASFVFASMGCNGGVEIPLNPIQSGAYARGAARRPGRRPGRAPAVEVVRARARARTVGVLQRVAGRHAAGSARRRRRAADRRSALSRRRAAARTRRAGRAPALWRVVDHRWLRQLRRLEAVHCR